MEAAPDGRRRRAGARLRGALARGGGGGRGHDPLRPGHGRLGLLLGISYLLVFLIFILLLYYNAIILVILITCCCYSITLGGGRGEPRRPGRRLRVDGPRR